MEMNYLLTFCWSPIIWAFLVITKIQAYIQESKTHPEYTLEF